MRTLGMWIDVVFIAAAFLIAIWFAADGRTARALLTALGIVYLALRGNALIRGLPDRKGFLPQGRDVRRPDT